MEGQLDTATASATGGLLSRSELASQLSKSERTIFRWEDAGLPVIRVGMTRLYDPASVRSWLLKHESRHDVPKRGRPSKSAA